MDPSREPGSSRATLALRAVLALLPCLFLAGAAPATAADGPEVARLPATQTPTPSVRCAGCWQWQLVPDGLIYRSYLAGRESRIGSTWFYEAGAETWLLDLSLGGRVGLVRYGSPGGERPQGWQLDVEGAGFPRLDMTDDRRDLDSADFRGGFPLTYGAGPWQFKMAYYHLSSHLGDEFMLSHPAFPRINFVRDNLVWGASWHPTDDVRMYGEAGWAFSYDGGAEPWEFQIGMDFAPARPTGPAGAPFAALNAHLREEADFAGTLTIETGWQWRGPGSGHLLRVGAHYLTGRSPQLEFFDEHEDQFGLGVWYDY